MGRERRNRERMQELKWKYHDQEYLFLCSKIEFVREWRLMLVVAMQIMYQTEYLSLGTLTQSGFE